MIFYCSHAPPDRLGQKRNAAYATHAKDWVTQREGNTTRVALSSMTPQLTEGQVLSLGDAVAQAKQLLENPAFAHLDFLPPNIDGTFTPLLPGDIATGERCRVVSTWVDDSYLDAGIVFSDGGYVNYRHKTRGGTCHSGDVRHGQQCLHHISLGLKLGETVWFYVNVWRALRPIRQCGAFSFMLVDDSRPTERQVLVAQPVPSTAKSAVVARITRHADTGQYSLSHESIPFDTATYESEPCPGILRATGLIADRDGPIAAGDCGQRLRPAIA